MYMKKIVIFGGGSGLSQLLKGLKLFPVEITAVVTVADNGKSTGRLRKELKIPAVGDISKVMLSMADVDKTVIDLMNYRFTKSKSLGNHSIKNLLLTALLDLEGSFDKAIPILGDMLNIHGTVLPLTEDNIDLVGILENGKTIVGEEQIIFSSGSLLTSIIPHLIDKNLVKEINKAAADKMYICNLFTQPGETDNFTVANHIDKLEEYLGKNSLDVVIANNMVMKSNLAQKYAVKEQKDPVLLVPEEFNKRKIKVISDKLFMIEDNMYRHDYLKTAYLIFSYLFYLNFCCYFI